MDLVQLELNKKMELNLKDFKRFEKQIILKKIGVAGQKKIKNSKVLIVGLGGLGCPLLIYLASAGISNIGLVDSDKIELSNLGRQTLFDFSDTIFCRAPAARAVWHHNKLIFKKD